MMLTHEQLADLRRLANKAVPSAEWFLSQHLNEVPFIDGAAAKFIVAANPEAILHMLHHIDAQQARITDLEGAIGSALGGPYYMDHPDGGSVTLEDQLQRMAKDAARYRWLRDKMLGVDFDWNESGLTALSFEMPDGCAYVGNCDQNIDNAMQATWPDDTSDYGSSIAVTGQNGGE